MTVAVFTLIVLVGTAIAIWWLLQPTNLGVTYAAADREAFYQKLGIVFEALPKSESKTLVLSGTHRVDQTFTSAELSAAADNRSRQYAYFPFRNVQIRVNTDGTVEGSGTVRYTDAVRYLVALGVSSSDIEEAAKKFNIPAVDIPVYLKASGDITQNTSNITIHEAKIARISVPANLVQEYAPAINPLIDMIIKSRPPTSIEKLEVTNGAVRVVGTAPNIERAVQRL